MKQQQQQEIHRKYQTVSSNRSKYNNRLRGSLFTPQTSSKNTNIRSQFHSEQAKSRHRDDNKKRTTTTSFNKTRRVQENYSAKMTLEQMKILSSIGAIKSFHELQYPIKEEELKEKLIKRAPIISRTLKTTLEMFSVFEGPVFQKKYKKLKVQQDDIENLTKAHSLLQIAFPQDKLPVTSPFAKTINLSEREQATLLRDWLNFMMGIHYQDMNQNPSELHSNCSSPRTQKSPKERLNFILMIVSYTMLQLRQQMSSYCNERGNIILKILKIILTIPNIFCELHEEQIKMSKVILQKKADTLQQQKDRELETFFKVRREQDKQIKKLQSEIKNNAVITDAFSQQIQKLRRRLNLAEGSLKIAQSKNIQELKQINQQQAKIMFEVYQNSKLDRIFVKENEKQIRQDYQKNQKQQAIKDYLNLQQEPQSVQKRKFGLNDILPPDQSSTSQKLELQAQISFDTLKQLLQFAKKNPLDLQERLKQFEQFLANREQMTDKQTFTGQDEGVQGAATGAAATSQGEVSRQQTIGSKQNQRDGAGGEDEGGANQNNDQAKDEQNEEGQNQKKDEIDEEIQQEKQMMALLMRLKENGQQEFMTQLPVKLKTMIKRFFKSLTSLPRDIYGDHVYNPEENIKLTDTLQRRGKVLRRILSFLDPNAQGSGIQEQLGQAGINQKHSKEVQTEVESLISDQAYKSWIITNAIPQLEQKRKQTKVKKNKSPKFKPIKLPVVKKLPQVPKKATTQVKAFKFQNKQIANSKIHPYSKLLAVLNKKIESGVMKKKFATQLSVRYLLKQINTVYPQKLQASKESPLARNQRLGEFFYDFTMNKYGLVKVTEKKVTEIVFSTSLHRNVIPDLQVIARFLGISNTVYRADDLNFYLEFCDQVNVMSNLNFPTFLKKEKNMFNATECYFGVAQEYIRALFEGKLAMMIHVGPNVNFKSEKEEYEYYYYFPLPMGVVIMIILDNYREFKKQIFSKIYPVAKSIIVEAKKKIAQKSAFQEDQIDDSIIRAQNSTPRFHETEEIMVMSIIQSIIFFDQTIYTQMKQFFERNGSMITMSQPPSPRQERNQNDMETQAQKQSPRTPTSAQQPDVIQKISLDFLCSFIFKKNLIPIR